jgi:3-oxoacyl-[acyl-carrier-protein] synthase II
MGKVPGRLCWKSTNRQTARRKNLRGAAGYGSTCDAYHITAPDPGCENSARAISDALREAGGNGGIYINAHGTGTPSNDVTETKLHQTALGAGASKALSVQPNP